MPLKVKSFSENQLILERDNNLTNSIIFIIIGAVFTLTGLAMLVLMPWQFPYLIIKLVFPMVGIVVLYAALNNEKHQKKTEVNKIVFDNNLGCVALEMANETQRGFIKYSEIEKFDVFVERQTSGKHTNYFYHTVLFKKDSGQWFLTKHTSQEKANETIADLNKKINLSNPYLPNIKPVFSNKLEKNEGLEKTTVSWRNEVKYTSILFLGLFAITFLIVLTAILYSFKDSSVQLIFPFIVVGFIFVVFAIIMFSFVKQMIKDATTKYTIAISRNNFEYLELNKDSNKIKLSKIIPMQELYSIVYNQNPIASNGQPNKLFAYNKVGYDQLMEYRNNPAKQFEAFSAAFTENIKKGTLKFTNESNNQIELVINALNPIECLQLETWLQETIKNKNEEVNVL